MREVYPNLELGLGLSYQDHGDPKKNTTGDWILDNTGDLYDLKTEIKGFKSVPLYAVAKYNFPVEGNIKPYIKADLGYSFNSDKGDVKVSVLGEGSTKYSTKVENGLYYGIGAGAEYNNFVVDLMYKVNRAEIKVNDEGDRIKKDLDYSRVTLSVGYKFNF